MNRINPTYQKVGLVSRGLSRFLFYPYGFVLFEHKEREHAAPSDDADALVVSRLRDPYGQGFRGDGRGTLIGGSAKALITDH